MPVSIGNVLLEKLIYFLSKHSGLKYDQYCQGYIHYSNRRHTQKKNTWLRKSADTAKTSLNFEKENPEY